MKCTLDRKAANLRCLTAAILLLSTFTLRAQEADHDSKSVGSAQHSEDAKVTSGRHHDYGDAGWVLRTYHLTSTTQQNDANEILIALRNMLHPEVKVYLVVSQSVIMLYAPPEQQELAQTIVKELDRLKPTYSLKYTISEIDGGKRTGVQHYSMVVFDGQRAVLKDGSKVPVVTGSPNPGEKGSAIYQYLDVGMNFDVTATRTGDKVTLKNKVEQSSVAEERTLTTGDKEPLIRQSVFEGVVSVAVGKPTVIGSMDVPDSNRRIEIELLVVPAS